MSPINRGYYNEAKETPAWVAEILKDLNGNAWNLGIESLNKRGGFESINVDVYGYDEQRGLAVAQLRRAYRRRQGRFMSIRKDYYLVGRNENGNAFAHPISSPCRSAKALETAEGPVVKALAEIWNVKPDMLDYIVRQGDVALIPCSKREIPAEAVAVESAVIAESHLLTPHKRGQVLAHGGDYWVIRAATLTHVKHQHETVSVREGVWRVKHGERAAHWGFTIPTAD